MKVIRRDSCCCCSWGRECSVNGLWRTVATLTDGLTDTNQGCRCLSLPVISLYSSWHARTHVSLPCTCRAPPHWALGPIHLLSMHHAVYLPRFLDDPRFASSDIWGSSLLQQLHLHSLAGPSCMYFVITSTFAKSFCDGRVCSFFVGSLTRRRSEFRFSWSLARMFSICAKCHCQLSWCQGQSSRSNPPYWKSSTCNSSAVV